jgi:hypothetical protein
MGGYLLQSSHGVKGTFEVVAPRSGGGLSHWRRDNDDPGLAWRGPTLMFGSTQDVTGAALIQGNFGRVGNLEAVANAGGNLYHYWRDDGGTWKWHANTAKPAAPFATGVVGVPSLIQSSHGTRGNFEVVAPLAGGGLAHWWRGNDSASLPWHGPTRFGSGSVRAAALLQSNFGPVGNLEVVALVGDQLVHWSRDDGATWKWSEQARLALEPLCDPTVGGRHAPPFSAHMVGIHAAVLRTRKIVLFGFSDTDAHVAASLVLDPLSGAVHPPPASHHLFCSGHCFLDDGRLLVAGGHQDELNALHTFDPDQESWTRVGEMANGRWYPTCTTLPDGKVFIISGTKNQGGPVGPATPINNTLQLYDPASGIEPERPLPVPFSTYFPSSFTTIDLYPFVYVLPSGKLFVHSRNTTRLYDLDTGAWEATQFPTQYPWSRSYPGAGTSVLLPLLPTSNPPYRAQVLVVGGGGTDPEDLTVLTPANKSAELLDLGAAQPAWRFTVPMTRARVMPDAVLLPDGTVAVVGGSSAGRADHAIDPVLTVELFDPVSGQWATQCPMRVPRGYHATALLLPDARVLVVGKDGLFNQEPYNYPEHRVEIFSPSYLFRGPRPAITLAPPQVPYATAFDIDTPDAGRIASVALLRAGAATHSFNMDQRHVGLAINNRTANRLTVTSPPNSNVAPPGFYMLFIVDTVGVPSVAEFVRLPTG